MNTLILTLIKIKTLGRECCVSEYTEEMVQEYAIEYKNVMNF